MTPFLRCIIAAACALLLTTSIRAQDVRPRTLVFGHDRDVPLAASVPGASDFVFVDWDRDGDNDLLAASGGSIRMIENVGSATQPRFANVFKSAPVVLKDPRVGRFVALIHRPGINVAEKAMPSIVGFERLSKIGDIGRVPLGLHLFTPRGSAGKVEWDIVQALGVDGKPISMISDTWMCPTLDVADFNGDGKDDLVVGLSHPSKAQPSGNYTAGFNTPQESWVTDASRIYVMYNRSTGDKLIFDEPRLLEADGKPIAPYGFPYPIAFDADRDGLTDLVVGQHKPGILCLRNVGTKSEPRFADAGLLSDDKRRPIESIAAIHPRFADLNGDGRAELIASTYFGCVTNLLQFEQADAAGGFSGWAAQGPLMMAGSADTPLVPQGIGTIEPIDWDNDGDIDMVIGSEPCAPTVVINEGSDAKPVWTVPAPLKFVDGSAVEYYSIDRGLGSVWGPEEWYMERVLPRLADWDGDGVRDLLTGSMGLRQLFMKGKILGGELRFERPIVFTVNGTPLAAAHRVQPAVVDFNGDGHPDLVALDDQNVLKIWPGNGTADLGKPHTYLDEDGKPLQLKTRILDIGHGRCSFDSVDWDLDGKPDLIVYHAFDRKRGGIYYYRASEKPMTFEKPVKFCPFISFHNGGIGLADSDGDGYLDIYTGGDGEHLHVGANPRGKLFILSGRELPVPPAVRKSKPKLVTTQPTAKR